MIGRKNYSILMSVYRKDNPDFLRIAMNSIWEQSVPTNDFVLVCDGPLNEALDHVIHEMEQKHEELYVLRLEKNVGLGKALNAAIKFCKNELIARMDSDDISRPDRCEKQIKVFQENQDLTIVGGIVEEFTTSKEHVISQRVPPETQNDILLFAKKRNPFNHPTVMYKKEAVESVGGYQDFYLLEDYYLWIRMLQKGFKGYNIQEPLLWMRSGADMFKRRSGWKYLKSQRKLLSYMNQIGMISFRQYMLYTFLRALSSLSPNFLREFFFLTLLRKRH